MSTYNELYCDRTFCYYILMKIVFMCLYLYNTFINGLSVGGYYTFRIIFASAKWFDTAVVELTDGPS